MLSRAPLRAMASCAIGLAMATGSAPLSAQGETVSDKLAYVAALHPERIYYCGVRPLGSGTSETRMTIDFELDGAGPVEAMVVVTGSVGGRPYSARIQFRGTAGPAQDQPEEAEIVLTEVYSYDADPLPEGAAWSDPDGDVITLRVEENALMGSQPYILNGTQLSEFGINEVRCLDNRRL